MLSQDEGKERKGAERLQAFEILQSKGSAVESASGNIFGAPLHPAALDAVSVRYFGRAAGERKADKGIAGGGRVDAGTRICFLRSGVLGSEGSARGAPPAPPLIQDLSTAGMVMVLKSCG